MMNCTEYPIVSDDSEDEEYDDYPSHPSHRNLLHHQSDELGIMPGPEPILCGWDVYTISSFVDPTNFHVICESGERETKQHILEEEMKNFYAIPNWKKNYKIKTSRVFVRRVYAWYNNKMTRWERVRVLNVDDMTQGNIFIECIDYGHERLVNVSDLMEMNPKFCWEPPLSSPAHLVHVQPINNQAEWSQEAVNGVLNLVNKGIRFRGVIFSTFKITSDLCKIRGDFERRKSLGLVLVPESFESFKMSLQAFLVTNGFAEGTGIGAGHPNLLCSNMHAVKSEKTFRNGCHGHLMDLVDDSYKLPFGALERFVVKNIYQYSYVDQNNLAAESIQTISSKSRRYSDMMNPEMEALENQQLLDEEYFKELPGEIKNCLGYLRFSHIIGPGNFYVQMVSDKDHLDELESELARKVQNRTSLTARDIKCGLFVAVLSNHANCRFKWCRAFVTETFDTISQAKVVLVDIGMECGIDYGDIRELPKEFLSVRPFCRRVHLCCPHLRPTNSTKGWTSEANFEFKEYIKAWAIENPVYFGFIPSALDKPVELNHFNEELIYSQTTKSWTTDQVSRTIEACSEYVKQLKNHHLLKHLFSSLGILIYYEVKSKLDECYKFDPVWDNLIQNGRGYLDEH